MLKLYWSPNTISAAVALTLNEGGVHWEGIKLDFQSAEQTRPDYLKVNPKGRVPALVTPGGTLTETGAILDYLAATAVAGMMPVDPLHAARVREVMYYLASTVHVNHAHMKRGARWADREESWADMQAKVPETMTASAAYLEEQVEGPFLFGEELTIADAYLFVVSTWFEADKADISACTKLRAFMEAMEARPSVKSLRQAGILV